MTQPPAPTPAKANAQGATILLLGFLILLLSCALILTVRVHVRLGALTDELIKLNAKIDAKILAPSGGQQAAPTPAVSTPRTTNVDAKPQAGRTMGVGERRSPIPLPGEEIDAPFKPAVLGEIAEARPIAPEPKPGEVIPWDQAHLHMGRTITIEGKIISTKRQATICFLNFTSEASGGDSFYLVVFKSNFDDWGGFPEQAFLDKTVRVTGKIEDHRGRSQMKINKKEQVERME